MVKIIYYADPTKDGEIIECDNISSFLLSRFTTRDELLDLRFFDNDILDHEIDQTGGEFLSINEGVVAITHDSMIPRGATAVWYVVVAVIAAAATILLTPDIPQLVAETGGSDQPSGTNRLSDSNNEARIDQRIDDIFGTVNRHVPSLWQVPFRIGVNNQEVEILYLCIGRGKYQIDTSNWYDGDTPIQNIPNASVNIYGPNTNPNVDTPETVIGGLIDYEVGVYKQSNDLNPSELIPPNEVDNANVDWKLTGSGSTGVMDATNIPDDFDMVDYYSVGQKIKLTDFNYFKQDGAISLYELDTIPVIARTFTAYEAPIDLGQGGTIEYEITAVTATSLTVTIPSTASAAVLTAWSEMSNYSIRSLSAEITFPVIAGGDVYYIFSTLVRTGIWGTKFEDTYYEVDIVDFTYNPLAGEFISSIVGPVFTGEGVTKVLLNFVSSNGFYKLVRNVETKVTADIQIKVYEVDENGDETGNMTPFIETYESNSTSITKSVFQTVIIELPYSRTKITAERLTFRDKYEDVSAADVVEWRDVYTFKPVSDDHFGDATTAMVLIPSNTQSRLIKQRKQNVDVTRLITEYQGNGVFGPAESYATDQFDQILIHQALDPYIGRLSLENINADGYMDVRDEIVDYFGSDIMTRFGYDFDTVNMTFQDTFMLVCDTVMCTPYVQLGVYDIFFEKKQTVSSMQITCRNKMINSESRKTDYDRKNDGVEISYRDNTDGVVNTIYLPSDQSSRNPERIELKGCTTALQATRYGNRVYNRQKYQIEYVEFDVDEFGRNIIPNKRIDSPDSTRFTKRVGVTNGYKVYDGEVVEVNGMTVELSEPCEFIEGEDHYITFTTVTGDNSAPILCTQTDEFTVSLSTLPAEPIYDGYEKDRTKYILVSEQLKDSVALIPKTIEFSLDDNGAEVHTISSVNYTDKYYQNDLDELE